MLKLNASICASKQFEINGQKFVTIEGFLQNIGIFKQTVKEELVPDSLEGKNCSIEFDVGVDSKFKPSLKVKRIELV